MTNQQLEGDVRDLCGQTLAAYTAAVRRMAFEEAACMLDREHEARKHIDNHAAFYARKIRELAIHVPQTCTGNREK